MLPNLGYGELLLIGVVALLLFGPKQIPEMARSVGRAINAFKAGLREFPGPDSLLSSDEKPLPGRGAPDSPDDKSEPKS